MDTDNVKSNALRDREGAPMGNKPEAEPNPLETARAFAAAAARYIKWVDDFNGSRSEDVRQPLKAVADLLSAACALLELPPFDERALASEEAREAATDRAAYGHLVAKLSLLPVTNYSLVFNPVDLREPAVVSVLQDDLADIYLDLQRGMKVFDSGALLGALWEWQLLFRTHWGRHAVAAQTALWAALQT